MSMPRQDRPSHQSGVSAADASASSVPSAQATISVAVTTPSHLEPGALRTVDGLAGCLEVRADLVGDVEPSWLRRHFRGELLYNLGSRQRGGAFAGGDEERRTRLLAAAEKYDVVDLEDDRDLRPELLAAIPPQRRRLSWHGPQTDVAALRDRLSRMVAVGARLYLVAPAITRAEQALAPLQFLRELGRSDVTAYGTGPAGMWSRLLAPWLGAPMVYSRPGRYDGSGVPALSQLVADYGFPRLPSLKELYGIVGRSVYGSMSPRLHNAGYRDLGLPALYLPFQVEEFMPFWREVVEEGLRQLGFPLRGVTVVRPHKEAALDYALMVSGASRSSASASCLVRSGGLWRADTSNTPALLDAFSRANVPIEGRRIAVVGCGGAGRAAAHALREAGTHPVLVNRGEARGRYAAALLDLPFVPLAEFSPRGFDIVVNATPCTDDPIFAVDEMDRGSAVLDMAYAPWQTGLVGAARELGLTMIDCWDVLLAETDSQFRMMTGERISLAKTRALLAQIRSAQEPYRSMVARTAGGTGGGAGSGVGGTPEAAGEVSTGETWVHRKHAD